MKTLTERTTAALAWIDSQLALCETQSPAPWTNDCGTVISRCDIAGPEPRGHIDGGYYRIEAEGSCAAFIATARAGYPAMLDRMKDVIEAMVRIATETPHLPNTSECGKCLSGLSLDSILATIENLK